jgi:DNA invertase Pin-like site-specific DNA recombinase/DNA-binding winged helix-turn-helix (wHTH) protein
MKLQSPVPAAQYVRMSTEDQQYSIANQEAAIRTYAENHGFTVTATYADAGKSGVAIKHRRELRRLLHHVTSGQAQYKTILVYDVSRWGRFQDVDEAAHYEFLCRSAGIPVRYCAEQFSNDGSLPDSMMKALKRTMAAEYSRELGTRVSAGQRRLALLGFRVVGDSGYGLRRMMVSPDGRRRIVLKEGERKAIKTDRTILVPGPKREVECVRTMFELAADGRKTLKEIAKELNRRNMCRWNGQPWDRFSVRNILTKEKYIGCNTYGKTTRRLCSPSRKMERSLWITNPKAFAPIVDRDIFNSAQRLLERSAKRRNRSDACYMRGMKRVLAREGKLTQRLLKQNRIFDYKTYYKRFGSITKAYELAGYRLSPATQKFTLAQKRVKSLRDDLYIRLKTLFSDRVRFIRLPGQSQVRPVVEIDARIRVAVYLCRATRTTNAGEQGWLLRVRPGERNLPALICTMDPACSKLLNLYVFPPFGASFLKPRVLRENQPWFAAGRKLGKLDDLCSIAKEVASLFQNNERCTVVDDILIAFDTWTIMLGRREIALGSVSSAIFNMLALNAGQVITRDRLLHSVSAKALDPANLNAHIHLLRVKLGAQARKRIQRVPGVGYMYVSPGKGVDRDQKV